MKVESIIRALAGFMIISALMMAHYVAAGWLWLAAFVGLNLLQSAFTGFCPAEVLLRRLGLGGKN